MDSDTYTEDLRFVALCHSGEEGRTPLVESQEQAMLFIIVNPNNCSDFSVHATVEEAKEILESQGFSLDSIRDIRPSPRARLGYAKYAEEGKEQRYIYCRNMGQTWDPVG